MNANRYVFRPPSRRPCNASPVHNSFGSPASNRPNTASPVVRPSAPGSSKRWNNRSSVDCEGAHPFAATRIRCTCAAVRAGFSLFNAAATSRMSASVRNAVCRGEGTNAAKPPCRHARIHRSTVSLE